MPGRDVDRHVTRGLARPPGYPSIDESTRMSHLSSVVSFATSASTFAPQASSAWRFSAS
jgi:hypothetical protein